MNIETPGVFPGKTRRISESGVEPPFSNTTDNKPFFRFWARKYRRENGYGREKIKRLLRDEFGKDKFGKEIFGWSDKTIESWFKGVPKGPPSGSVAFDVSECASSDRPYLMQLDFLKRSMFQEQSLTKNEAVTAKNLRYFFESPDGTTVDLFAQLAVIDAYTHFSDTNEQRDAIDSLLALQPWKREGAAIYRVALQRRKIEIPFIPMLNSTVDSIEDGFRYTQYKVGAIAHLGIPEMVYYRRDENRFDAWPLNPELSENLPPDFVDPEVDASYDWAKLCNWRLLAVQMKYRSDESIIETLETGETSNDNR